MGCLVQGLIELMGWLVMDVLQSGAERLLVLLGLMRDPLDAPHASDSGDGSA